MVVILLFLGVTGAVVPLAVTETAVSANHRRAVVALYAAEAGLEWVTHELGAVTDWSDVLRGRVRSGVWSATAQHRLPGGASLDLGQVTDDLNDRFQVGGSHPSPRRWRLFLHGPFDALVPTPSPGGMLVVVVWVSDDLDDVDADPMTDTNGAVLIRAAAFGPSLAQRAIEATVLRHDEGRVGLASWRVDR
jgi:hypothetical protein